VLHDRSDDVTPFKGSRELAAVWPGAEFVETFGTGATTPEVRVLKTA
jgi:hypothetical protein